MKPKILLRIAAVLIFIHAVLHTMGFSGWKDAPDPVEHQVIAEMTGHQFPFMGAVHSLGDYYDGFGYASSIALLLMATILWITSGETGINNAFAKKVSMCLCIALAFWAIDEVMYFFPFAASITGTACLSTFLALYLMKKQPPVPA